MTAVGIDTHKDSLAVCVVDELGNPVAERTFANDPAAHAELLSWAQAAAPGATIGIEGSSRYGAAAARFLLDHPGGAAAADIPRTGANAPPGQERPG